MHCMSSDTDLKRFREHIDKADDKIVEALKERMDVVQEIRDYKNKNKMEVHDQKRVDEILDTRATMGGKNLTADFMRKIFRLIIDYSEELQRK